jgi:drug/metabolite transporter (DMT)-like permease
MQRFATFPLPQGVLAILIAVFAMALTDAIIKLSSSGMVLWQIWILRSGLVLPVLLGMVMATRGLRVAKVIGPGTGWVVLRSAALVAQYICLYAVLPLMDMAMAGAAFYVAPFFIVGLSAPVLGMPITLRHWGAICIGFAGLLLIVRPFGTAFTPLIVLPILAAAFYALAAIVTRARCTAMPPLVIAFWLNLACLGGGLLLGLLRHSLPAPDWAGFIIGPWHAMMPRDWGMIAALSVLILVLSISLARAYQSPRPEVIAALDYVYMIFVVFWGYVIFAEVPDLPTLLGIALIAGGGLMMLRIRAPASPQPTPPLPA